MPGIPKPKKKYAKPKFFDLERRPISSFDLAFKHSSPEKKFTVYDKWLSDEQIEIMQHLAKAGLNVETPFLDRNGNLIVIKKDNWSKRILTKHMGKTLDLLFPDIIIPKKRVALEIVSQLAELLARIHEEGFCHFHPKRANVTWDGKRVGLIDFKLARNYNSFDANHDLKMFIGVVDLLGLSPYEKNVQELIKRIDESRPKKK